MSITCFIVDDQPSSVASLSRLIEAMPGIELVGAETDALTALNLIRSGTIKTDILFLDINMPDIDGVEFAYLVNNLSFVIFITAYLDHAIDAFDVGAVDYLLKPVKPAALVRAIERAADRINKRKQPRRSDTDTIYIRKGPGNLIQVRLNEIIWVKAIEKYSLMYLAGAAKPLLITSVLAEVESFLPGSLFIRVHRSYIVSFRHITAIMGNEIKLSTSQAVTIGQTYKEAFFSRINPSILQRPRVEEDDSMEPDK